MQQEPTPTTGSGVSSNRNLILSLIAAGVAVAGVAGLALWFGGQAKIKRKRPASKKAADGKAATQAATPGGKKPLCRADDAKITLEKASQMTIDQIQTALERAEAEGDKASQINILFLLASSLLQQEQLEKQHIDAAIQYYTIALQFAEDINSEMLGPILLELATLSFSFKNYPQAMALFEQGLKNYLEAPEEEVEATNLKHMLSLFAMLGECYFNTKQYQRGIDFILEFLKGAEGRKEHTELFPSLMLSVGEFSYALKDYASCITYLEKVQQVAELSPDVAMMCNYYLASANVNAENREQGVKYLEAYLESAKLNKAPVEGTLDSIMSLIICYKELGQRDLAAQTVDRAQSALKQIDEGEHPLLCLKQLYFLGLYCLNKLDELDRGRDLLERAFTLAKSNAALSKEMPWATIAIDLAEAYHKLKLRQEALKMIETGLTGLRERDSALVPPALIRQAKIYSELGDKATAVGALEEALKVTNDLEKGAKTGASSGEVNNAWLSRFLKFQLGKMYTLMGQLSKADSLLSEAFASFVGTTDLEIRTVVLATIASNLAQAGQKEEALKKVQEVLDVLSTATTQKLSQGDIRTELGECYLFLGDYAKAKAELESALEQFAKDKNEKSELLVLVRLAAISDWLGEGDVALQHLARAEKAKDLDSSVIHIGSVGAGFALHYLAVGDIAKAQAQADQVASYVDAACCGSTPLNVLSFNGLMAETNFWSNRMDSAIQHFQRCLQHISTSPHARENIVAILNVQTRLAGLSLYMENRDQDANALSMLAQLLPLARAKGSLGHVAQLLALTGLAKARTLDDAEAEVAALFAEALSVADETADRRVIAQVNRLAGSYYSRYAAADKADEGRKHLDQALALARQLGDQLLEAVVLRDLAIVALKEQAAEEHKERTWKEATAGALEIAERTGNRYLAHLLAHLPGQAPAPSHEAQEARTVEAETKPEEEEPTTAQAAPLAEESSPVAVEEEAKEEVKGDESPAQEDVKTNDEDEVKPVAVEEEAKEEVKGDESPAQEDEATPVVVEEEAKEEVKEAEEETTSHEDVAKPEEEVNESPAQEEEATPVVVEEEAKEEVKEAEEEKHEESTADVDQEDKVTIEDVTEEEQNE